MFLSFGERERKFEDKRDNKTTKYLLPTELFIRGLHKNIAKEFKRWKT